MGDVPLKLTRDQIQALVGSDDSRAIRQIEKLFTAGDSSGVHIADESIHFTVAGNAKEIQYNDGTTPAGLASSNNFTYDSTTETLNLDNIDFNLTSTVANAEGRLAWDSDDGTLRLGMPGGNVTLQIGQENLIRSTNKTGLAITDFKAVYIDGAQGNRPTIDLTDITDSEKIQIAGITTEAILNNNNGFINVLGLIRDVDTSGTPYGETWNDGDKLYLGTTAGGFSNTHPSSPTDAVIIVATVIRAHATEGSVLFSRPEAFTIGNNYDGTMRQSVINKSSGTSAAVGFTAVNDNKRRATFGLGGSNNSVFPDTTVYYGEGYGDNWYAVDGNKDHVFYTDPTDSHNNSALSYPRLYIRADGTLEVGATSYETLVISDDVIPNKKYVDDNDFWDRTGATLTPKTSTDTVKATDDFQTEKGRKANTNRITSNTILDKTYHEVYCDTDGGAFTVTLPALENGREYRIHNVGSSGNNVTLSPDGTDLLFGVNASEPIYDGEVLVITGETTEGWD